MPVYCPNCGAENRDAARFCMQCSASLTTPSSAQEQVCANCGTRNPTAARYCLHCATPLHAATPAAGLTGLLPQNYLLNGRYAIVKRLGKGGMGAVYQASDTRISGKLWAVKEMSDAALVDPADKQQARDAFQREAQMLALLDHVNLPKVNDFFTEGGKLYLVMDFIQGQTFEAMLDARTGPLPEAQVLEWAGQLCDVLNYLHHRTPPIIFRDLKPGNIMMDTNGRVKLIDFGVARLFKVGKQRDTESFGTAGYAPPEQYGKGQTDARSDIYALGVTLHQLLTGYDPTLTPFNLPSARNVNPAVSAHVEQALIKATQAAQASRYQNALEFKAALLTAPKPQMKTTVAAPSPQPIFQPTPVVVQPVAINPPAASVVAHRHYAQRSVSPVLYFFGSITIGVVCGLLFQFLGWPLVMSNPSIGLIAYGLLYVSGALAYFLLHKPGAMALAWISAYLTWRMIATSNGVNFTPISDDPTLYVSPLVFEFLARTGHYQRESTGFAIGATVAAIELGYVAGVLLFGWGAGRTVADTMLYLAIAGLIAGIVGRFVGRRLRQRMKLS